MKRHLQITITILLLLLSVGFVHAQEENALDKERQIVDKAQDVIESLQNGYTTPMRIVGSSGNTSVNIAIDTMSYERKGVNDGVVLCNAHVDLQIPFALEDGEEETKLNFKGSVILAGDEASRLSLETKVPSFILVRDKISLHIIADEHTFVSLGCDGIEQIGLHGEFVFNPNFLIPVSGNAADTVKASFQTIISDWDDLQLEVVFNRDFKISGGGDFIFRVDNVVADFSIQSNVPEFTFPAGYETAFLDNDVNLWTGFAIKEIVVTPPSEISELDEETRPFAYSVSNMLIDELGLTGAFMAMRAPRTVASTDANSGLNISIDTIGVAIVRNCIASGILGGNANVPFLKDKSTDSTLSLGVNGQIQYDVFDEKLHYRLSGTMLNSQTFVLPFANNDKADITLDQGCTFAIGSIAPDARFGAQLLLNGSLNIRSELNVEGIRFEGFELSSFSPYFDWKYFGLVSSTAENFSEFPISLTELKLIKESEELATLNVAAQIALMSDAMSIGAKAGFRMTAAYEQTTNKWQYEKFIVDSISVDMDYSAFRFKGFIARFSEDRMYGDGFRGSIDMTVKSFNLAVKANIYFGKTIYNKTTPNIALAEPFKYWFTEIKFDVPSGMYLFPPYVGLKSITGGAYQCMTNSLVANVATFNENSPKPLTVEQLSSTPQYIPDKETSFGFVAGIGAYFAQRNLVSVEVLLEMAFNSHCGLRYVSLKGLGSFLSEEIDKGLIQAAVFSYYDVENKIFSLNTSAEVNFVDVIKGEGRFVIYNSPTKWYCNVGTHSNPNVLRFADLANVTSYFMAGEIPAQLPPLNSRMLALFGSGSYSNAGGSATNGNGFAFGIDLEADCGFGQKKGFVFAYILINGGIDALINFNPSCHQKPDVKWRGAGQLYCYMEGAAGVRVRKKKFEILNLTGAAALQAQIPAPYYFSGNIAFKYKVLFIKGKINRGFSKGTSC